MLGLLHSLGMLGNRGPDPLPTSPAGLAASRRAALKRRALRIRGYVAAGSLALFTAAFMAIYVQLANGHDPALSAAARRSASAATGGSPQAGGSAATPEGGGSAGTPESGGAPPAPESGAATGAPEASEPSAVRTRQS